MDWTMSWWCCGDPELYVTHYLWKRLISQVGTPRSRARGELGMCPEVTDGLLAIARRERTPALTQLCAAPILHEMRSLR